VPQLPPNKLVKRASGYNSNAPTVARRRSRSHLPTLRRPATSHQRSATLQQFQQPETSEGSAAAPKYSLDQHIRPTEFLSQAIVETVGTAQEVAGWTSYFHSRSASGPNQTPLRRGSESSPNSRSSLPLKRICINIQERSTAFLIRPSMVSTAPATGPSLVAESQPGSDRTPAEGENTTSSSEDTPTKRARRSISMHFSSPTNWISRTGSIRRPKRGQDSKVEGKRHVSAPVANPQPTMKDDYTNAAEEPAAFQNRQVHDLDLSTILQPRHRKRNSSSPLPPLSRLSSFNIDLNKLGAATTAAPQQPRQNQPSGSSQGSSALTQLRGSPNERSSTMNSSDMEGRDFGDDDDTDFRSDTMFDSIRTVASGRMRNVETPLESMFDDSPPSTAGNNRTKRLSIQEILGRSWDGDDKIMEEDEGAPTPVRSSHEPNATFHARRDSSEPRFSYEPTSQEISLASRDFSRLSLDDDLDDDWAKDDDMALSNHLSPPSNSIRSRDVSPNLKMALASISGNGSPEAHHSDANNDRPLSNLFEWSEAAVHDKLDADGQSPRPKTVHGKQEMDVRGGRSATRKGPTAAHVRSQSVPVVHDPSENAKSATAKYGTWGLGKKTEDWDDDFEFEESPAVEKEGKPAEKTLTMVVPASIQAAQPSVKAHSGQIRELSLLVNDLKRLCRHGRDLDMLGGPQAGLWKEAEGIIALASPDEDAMDGMDIDSDTGDFDVSTVGERFADDGFDAESLDKVEDAFDARDLVVSKTAVIRERHSGRRRSVFSPDDDIFGGSWPAPEDHALPERPRTPDNTNTTVNGSDVNVVVRSVMEAMQNRSASDPLHSGGGKLHFGTNSLKALVKRAGDLRDALSDIVRRADPIAQSPVRTPRHDPSPAFTRVFTDPSSSPPRRLPHSRSNNSVLSRTSMDTSPSNALSQRMMMTTVS
jgi:hypothetical protein